MSHEEMKRRDFIRALLAGASVMALDWSLFPTGGMAEMGDNEFDAVIIGSGLGGLSCAAAFAAGSGEARPAGRICHHVQTTGRV
jgi:hypothetical protein